MITAIQNRQVVEPIQPNAPFERIHLGNRDALYSNAAILVPVDRGICGRIGDWFRTTWISIRNAFRICFCGQKMKRIIALEDRARELDEARSEARVELFNAGQGLRAAQVLCDSALTEYLQAIIAAYPAARQAAQPNVQVYQLDRPEVGAERIEEARAAWNRLVQTRRDVNAAFERFNQAGQAGPLIPELQNANRELQEAHAANDAAVEQHLQATLAAYRANVPMPRQEVGNPLAREINPVARNRYMQACNALNAANQRLLQAIQADREALDRYDQARDDLNNNQH